MKPLLALLAFCSLVSGQTRLISTTLSAAVGQSDNTITVASATGISGTGVLNVATTLLFVDKELMRPTGVIGNAVTVVRGERTRIAAHASGAIVYAGDPGAFSSSYDKSGACLTENFLPIINVSNGHIFDCRSGRYVQISDGTGVPVTQGTSTNLAGTIDTTTGSIASGSNSLTVGNPTGWSVGMGIAIHNASGATELITQVTEISGTAFSLKDAASATVSGATVYHDDTAAIRALIAAGGAIHLPAGNYNVTCAAATMFTIGSPVAFTGDGAGLTILRNRCATDDLFLINYEVAGTDTLFAKSALFADFGIIQDAGVTATGGYGFRVQSASGAGHYVTGLHIERIQSNNIFGLVYVGTGVITNWFKDLYCYQNAGANCIVVDSPGPSGDNFWTNINTNNVSGSNGGILIQRADTQTFSHVKVNGSNFQIVTSAGHRVDNLRIVDASIESGNLNINATTGTIEDIHVTGGEIGITGQAVAAINVRGLVLNGVIIGSSGSTHAISLSGGDAVISGCDFDAGGVMVDMTNGAQAAITGNTVQQNERSNGTFFVKTDDSITSGLAMSGNVSTLANSFNAASLVPLNQIPALITPASSSASCTAGTVWVDASYVYACTAAGTVKRAALSGF